VAPLKFLCTNYFITVKNRPNCRIFRNRKIEADLPWGSSGKEARLLTIFRPLLSRMVESNRRLLFHMAQRMAKTRGA